MILYYQSQLIYYKYLLTYAEYDKELLRHIMNASGTRNVDLIGSSGVVSEVVNGKRAISREQAKSLGKFFKLSPALFI